MNKLVPKTISGKIWVLFLVGYSANMQFRTYQLFGDNFGLAFLIDALISIVFNYFVFYALPVAIYERQKKYFKGKRNKQVQEEE